MSPTKREFDFGSCANSKGHDQTAVMNDGEQRPELYFALAQDDLNMRVLRMLESTFSVPLTGI